MRRELPARLLAAGFALATKTPPTGDCIVIGIAVWNALDLELLDRLCEASTRIGVRVEVFSLDDCDGQAAIKEYVPVVGRILQTPVAAVWKQGTLRDAARGHAARTLVVRELGL
jgi:hypothetical protein